MTYHIVDKTKPVEDGEQEEPPEDGLIDDVISEGPEMNKKDDGSEDLAEEGKDDEKQLRSGRNNSEGISPYKE